ncbi:MAG: hypothetical protein KW804_00185 [Candidatus Doudnabacteria bacterium]|nr:hypothetical protein [Candidatus Doudnabacteria bacterium]
MERLVLLILLLTVVYSWEESKYVLVAIWSKITGRNKYNQRNYQTDILVSDVVMIATIPLSLVYMIMTDTSLPRKLLLLLLEFLFLGLLVKGLQEYTYRRYMTRHYQGYDKFVAIMYSLLGLVAPAIGFASNTVNSALRPGKYLLSLVMPLGSGLALAMAVRYMGMEEFVSKSDQLIAIATLALIMNVTIEVLEKISRTNRMNLSSLFRVALGIAIVFVLTISK